MLRQPPATSRRFAAFTLVELLVVISIIIILLAVSIPTIRALTKSNSQKQAVNLLTTLLANARATAISTHKYSGIVVYEYPAPTPGNGTESTSYVQLITQSSVSGRLRYFTRVPRTAPQRLPSGIQVATLDDTGFKKASDNTTTKCRAIIFDSTGQMLLVNGLGLDPSLTADQVAVAWNLNATSTSTVSQGVSSPGFVVYDAILYMAAHNAPGANDNLWLRQNADVVILNPYTGNVIR
jgi:type II secretory pathway pseudopilin PulG